MAQIPISLGLLCSEYLDMVFPRLSWLEILQPRPTNLKSNGCYISNSQISISQQVGRSYVSAVLKYG